MSNARNLAKLLPNASGELPAANLASSAVTEAKIASSAITEAKLASSAVSTAKLAANAVTYDKIEAQSAIRPGTLALFVVDATPTGWLRCNGATVSRTTYANLFAAIGTSYGSGDGSTTFGLPDCRGEFPRFWDNGRGLDSGRSIGSWQKGSVAAINIPFDEGLGGMYAAGNSGDQSYVNAAAIAGLDLAYAGQYVPTKAIHAGAPSQLDNTWYVTDGWGGGVTRPRNLAFLACIKF